jgi:hypothetical protein
MTPHNRPLQTDEARDVQLGTFAQRGAPSFRAGLTFTKGLRR